MKTTKRGIDALLAEFYVFIRENHWSVLDQPSDAIQEFYYQRGDTRPCAECGTEFVHRHGSQRFCSSTCRERAKKRRYRIRKAGHIHA